MITMTTMQPIPNVTHYDVVGNFDLLSGAIGVRLFLGATNARFSDFLLAVSDTAGASVGLGLNQIPQGPGDTYVRAFGVGAAGSLTNAVAAYRAAANHLAGVKAVLLRGVVDGWLDATLAGS